MKPKVIFIHPLKTGGTSVRYMLLNEYGFERVMPVPMGDAFGKQDEAYPVMRGYPLQVQKTITPETVAGYDVVMSHYDWGIVNRLPGWQVITILRDPVEQIRSLYQYMVDRPHLFPDAAHMSALGFAYWVQSKYGRPFLNNQTAFLSSHQQRDYVTAVRNLQDERVSFGLLERFEETVQRWNRRFGWSMTVEHRNKTDRPYVMDTNTRTLVQGLQKDDMMLWTEATRKFGENS